jgi:hypothetical protein
VSARVAAGRLTYTDLGKTITAPWRGGDAQGVIESIHHTPDAVVVWMDHIGAPCLTLHQHTLVTITGRAELGYDPSITPKGAVA